MWRSFSIGAVIVACVCRSSCAFAKARSQALLNVPIAHFAVPGFDSNGHKKWEVSGASATMTEENLFSVQSLKLSCFSEGEMENEIFSATSDEASVMARSHMARGKSEIRIAGQKFSASAGAWEFFGDSKKIIARDNVTVFIDCGEMEVPQ